MPATSFARPLRVATLATLASLLGSFGAAPAFGEAPGLSFQVVPAAVTLDGRDDRQQLAVSVVGADGSSRDVTWNTVFHWESGAVADVSARGVVRPRSDGEATLRLSAAGLSATIPVVVRNATEARPVSYRRDVAAVLSKAGCNMGACHGNLNGKGGFRLSLRGEDPAFDWVNLTHEALGRRVNLTSPTASLAYLKPTGQVGHEGGVRFGPESPEAASLLAWMSSGARDDIATAPTVVRLTVSPGDRTITAPCKSQQLVVTAEFSDGTRRDVTRQAAYDVSDPTRASVDVDGRVEVGRPTETVVAVRYLNARGVSRLAFLHDRPEFVWRDRPVRNEVDRHVFAKLRSLKILPAEPATDAVFLRRAYLDAIGRLPTPDEARRYLDQTNPIRRNLLIQQLLVRPEFADHWALKWADLLRNEEKTMGEKGVWVFQRWLRDQVDADRPLDGFVRQLLTAKGSTWSNPPASFYRTNRDPQTTAETVAQVFLGVRLQCARCHNHPFDVWTQDDYYGLAAYFGNVRRKDVNNQRKDNLDRHEITGDEYVYLDGPPGAIQPRSGASLDPRPPQTKGPSHRSDDNDARTKLAAWLTVDNRQFARNLANRVWFHLMGRGVVEPVDDFRESNPPSNPALLEALADALVSNGYQLRPLVTLIMNSEAYQFGSEPNETNADDEANFARASVRLLPAEVLLDALSQALGKSDQFRNAPAGVGATQLPGTLSGSSFLKTFGKPDRLLTCECERSESTTLGQAFQLINGDSVRAKLESPTNRIGRLIESGATDDGILDELTLAALSRRPRESERVGFLEHVRRSTDRRKAWEDVAWAIVNSKEFLLRH